MSLLRTITSNEIQVKLSDDISEKEIDEFPACKTWAKTLKRSLEAQKSPNHPFHENPYRLRSITVQAVDRFGGGRIGFIKLQADIRTDDDQKLPGSIFMRGGSVAMLLILQVEGSSIDDDQFVILTKQPRIPAGSLSFIEIPAGMVDASGTFSGAAAKEIEEETGLTVEESELVDMTELAVQSQDRTDDEEDVLQNAVYPSPGGSDEFIPIFLARKTISQSEIDKLQGKLTGLRDHGEKITLKIVKLNDAWKVAARDAKTLSALCLYEGLRRDGKL